MRNLLEVLNLRVHYAVGRAWLSWRSALEVPAVDGMSFTIAEGETLGLVGESGSGKTTTARAILQLVRPTSGAILFKGEDLCALRGSKLRKARGAIGMVFQDLNAALNPRMTIGRIVEEPLKIHSMFSRTERRARVSTLLQAVGLDEAHAQQYPHALSGGQRQRVSIARAIATEPPLLLADEPVSCLDCSVQAQILNLLADVQKRLGTAILFVSHNLAVVKHTCCRVAVMHEGRVVEEGTCDAVISSPQHPVTKRLLGDRK